jgi:hypothetical protein
MAEHTQLYAEPMGGPLILRHASKRSSGTWGPDDYDVFQGGQDIGCIFKPRAGMPEDLHCGSGAAARAKSVPVGHRRLAGAE